MIEGPGVWWRFHEDDVTRQQVRPGTARRVWPYLRRYRGPVVLLVLITAVDAAIVVTIPLILRLIIDDGILRNQASVVVGLALAVAGLALVEAGAQHAGSRYSETQRAVGGLLAESLSVRSQRLVRQELQLSGELSAMTAERSDVSGALLAMLYGRPEEDAGLYQTQFAPQAALRRRSLSGSAGSSGTTRHAVTTGSRRRG